MTTRKYSSRAQQTTLSSGITSGDTTMTVGNGANLMGGKTPTVTETYTVVIDPDTALEEIVDVSNYTSGNTVAITRARDGSTAVAHSAGAVIRHMVIGRDLSEANTHIEGTLAGHAATTSAQLAGIISDETGSGSLVFATTPTLTSANLVTPALGTPSAAILTNATGLPISTGVVGLGSGVATFLAVPSSANLASTITDETGSGALVFGTSPTISTPTITAPTMSNLTLSDSQIVFEGVTADAFETTLTVVDPTADRIVTIPNIDGTLVTTGDTGTVTSTMILDGTILNADVNASAALAYSKLALTGAIVNNDITNDTITNAKINTAAAIDKTKISGTAITAGDTGTVTSTMILDGTILNADINAAAAIDKTKISGTAVTVADTGTVTSTMILDGTILNADINASAAIALSKLATDPLARANHTGTQLAATVSDFDTQVRTSRLDQMAAPTAAVPLNAQKITGLADPTLAQDAATKAYTDLQITNLIAAAPGALNTLDELAAALGDDASFATTVTNSLAAKLPLAGGTMSGAIAMTTNKITGLGTPTVSTDAATKAYADTMLPLSGGALSGALAMGTNKITGLGTPTVSTDASTKAYADTMLPLAGGTMSGAIAMGSSKITGLGTPTANGDAVTKAYADSILVGAPGNLTGPITSVGAATSIASQTGTGTTFVMNTSPTLVTPVLGVATATSINATAIPSTKTLVVTTDKLSALAATTSAELAGVISDETGSGALVFATSPTFVTPALGTPSAVVLTSGTGLPISTGVSGLGTGVATFLATPSSANLAAALTDETGSGANVFANSPTLTTPSIGVATGTSFNSITALSSTTPIANGTAAVGTGTTTARGDHVHPTTGLGLTSGTLAQFAATTSAQLAGVISDETGSGGLVFATSPTLVTPTLGVASASSLAVTSATAATNGIYLPAANSVALSTNSTERMRITSTGTILVNTNTSNGPTIEVINTNGGNGTIVSRGSTAADSTIIQAQANDYYSVPSYTMSGIGQHSQSATGTTLGIANAGLGFIAFQNTINAAIFTNGGTPLVFGTLAAERMRITSTGLVGIGTTPSGAMLHVINNTAGNVGTIIKGAASQTGDLLQVQNSAGSELFTIDSAGNVGINAGTPSYTLDVAGTTGQLRVTSSTGTNQTRLQVSNTGGSFQFGIDSSTGSNFGLGNYSRVIWNDGAHPLILTTNSAERMRIDSSGSVGIGTASPSSKLAVGGNPPTAGALAAVCSSAGVSLALSDNVNNSLYVRHTSGGAIIGGDPGGGIRIAGGGSTATEVGIEVTGAGSVTGTTTIYKIADGTTTTGAIGGGYMGLPQNSATTGAYGVVAADAGKHIYSTATRTLTIPANSSVAMPIGTTITFIATTGATVTIAITTDTMYLAGAGTTGSRTLAAHGMATAVKVASTTWYISGNGLT